MSILRTNIATTEKSNSREMMKNSHQKILILGNLIYEERFMPHMRPMMEEKKSKTY